MVETACRPVLSDGIEPEIRAIEDMSLDDLEDFVDEEGVDLDVCQSAQQMWALLRCHIKKKHGLMKEFRAVSSHPSWADEGI